MSVYSKIAKLYFQEDESDHQLYGVCEIIPLIPVYSLVYMEILREKLVSATVSVTTQY